MAYYKDWDKFPVDRKLSILNDELNKSMLHWMDLHENGCSDPHWPDGVNMNLVRNHIIYYLRQIAELEQKPRQISMFDLQTEAGPVEDVMKDKRIPPLVDGNYMAKERKCGYFEMKERTK